MAHGLYVPFVVVISQSEHNTFIECGHTSRREINDTEKNVNSASLSAKKMIPTKRQKTMLSCPGFAYQNEFDLLSFYNKFNSEDDPINKTIYILFNNKREGTHSAECTDEEVTDRKSLYTENNF